MRSFSYLVCVFSFVFNNLTITGVMSDDLIAIKLFIYKIVNSRFECLLKTKYI